jgi:hypothetical protein
MRVVDEAGFAGRGSAAEWQRGVVDVAGVVDGLRLAAPARGVATAIVALVCAFSLPAHAQPKARPAAAKPDATAARPSDKKPPKEKTFDFNNLKLNGQLRTPQLLYFLERANEELERASLEKRSFIPHIVRSVEEEAL